MCRLIGTNSISMQRQRLWRSERDIRESKIGNQCMYDGEREEQEEVDEISFRLGARVN